MKALFQVYRDTGGKYRFRLRAPNNKIVAVGEAYERKAGCINGINAIKRYCDSEIIDLTVEGFEKPNPKFEIFLDTAKKFRFRLKAPNGEIIAASEAYETKQGCMNGVNAVKRYCNSKIEDLKTEQIIEEATKVQIESAIDITESSLELFEPVSGVDTGSIVTFQGKLIECGTGKGIDNAEIEIYESDRSFMKDDYMASGKTGEDGSFSIDWEAKPMDWWDNTVEVYARFKGTKNIQPSKTKKFIINVSR